MAAAQHARRALEALDYVEADFMMQHQAEIAGLLSNASLSMGVGKDMLDQGLKQVSNTLTSIEQLHQRDIEAARQVQLAAIRHRQQAAIVTKRQHGNAAAFGLAVDEPRFSARRLHDHLDQVIGSLAPRDAAPRLAALGIQILAAEARFVDARTISAGETLIRADEPGRALEPSPDKP